MIGPEYGAGGELAGPCAGCPLEAEVAELRDAIKYIHDTLAEAIGLHGSPRVIADLSAWCLRELKTVEIEPGFQTSQIELLDEKEGGK